TTLFRSFAVNLLTTGDNCGAGVDGFGNQAVHVIAGFIVDDRTNIDSSFGAAARLASAHGFSKFCLEFIGNTFMNQDAVCSGAGFTHVPQFRVHGALDSGVEVSVIKNDEWRVATQ